MADSEALEPEGGVADAGPPALSQAAEDGAPEAQEEAARVAKAENVVVADDAPKGAEEPTGEDGPDAEVRDDGESNASNVVEDNEAKGKEEEPEADVDVKDDNVPRANNVVVADDAANVAEEEKAEERGAGAEVKDDDGEENDTAATPETLETKADDAAGNGQAPPERESKTAEAKGESIDEGVECKNNADMPPTPLQAGRNEEKQDARDENEKTPQPQPQPQEVKPRVRDDLDFVTDDPVTDERRDEGAALADATPNNSTKLRRLPYNKKQAMQKGKRTEEAAGLVSGKYTGDIVEGIRHGHGVLEWADGSRYEGGFVNGLREGHGDYVCENGQHTYAGEWKQSKRHGKGVETWPNGESYIGDFKWGRFDGHGVYASRRGRYEGEWAKGAKCGRGRMKWRNGDRYDGQWKDGRMHGEGTYIRKSDESIYVGSWARGLRNGQGAQTFKNGEKYDGEWRDNLQHGVGIFRYSNGRWRKGEFENGKKKRWLTEERIG